MGRLPLGPIRQIAFAVADLDVAMAEWTRSLGVGPFFVKRRIELVEFAYRGEPRPSPTISIALAASGGMQFELIAQHDERPSLFREWLVVGREGPHHVSSWHTSAELAAMPTAFDDATLAQSATIPASGTRLLYWETGRGAPFFEMSDLCDARHRDRVAAIERAAAGWAGDCPVREVDR